VAHEEGNLNDLRAILGKDVAIKLLCEGRFVYTAAAPGHQKSKSWPSNGELKA